MSLGVLNNLSAVYAENNLNNSNNSLNTVLQQLSSGSKINSGSDDAAGLSLVDGLQANRQALTQSATNAAEGVGLLQVADGALSQVTSLLNRAVTLATEASNGTLNSSQDTAANQEYQSILSEISNIGTTTTYNDAAVFNTNTNIYTGDSSTTGSSVDALDIRTLSASNVGDTGGVMAYSNGQNNVFLNLSSSTKNAQATDTLNGSSSTVTVNYLVKGADAAQTTATTTISVGTGSLDPTTGTTYANTANGLISAINNAGLGLTASFTTQAQAGVAGGGTQTGIQITGGLVSAGVDPGAVSTSGTLNPSAITNENLTLGQVITVKVGSTTAAAITINSSTNTLSGLEQAINTASSNINGASTYVTASIVTNGAGLQSLSLADTANTGGALSVTSVANALGPNTLTTGTSSNNAVNLTYTTNTQGTAGVQASATLGIAGTNYGTDTVNGTIVLSNNTVQGAGAISFVMGGSAPGTSGFGVSSGGGATFTVNGSTLTALANAIQNQLNVTTSVGTSGITMTANATGTILETVGSPNLTNAASLAVSNNEGWTAATNGLDAISTIAMNGDGGFQNNGSDVFTGNLVLSNTDLGNQNAPVTFAFGGTAGTGTVVVGNAGQGNATMTNLLTALTADAALGITGTLSNHNLVLTSGNPGTSITVGANPTLVSSPALSATTTPNTVGSLSTNAYFTTGGPSTANDIMAGAIVLTNDGVTDTFAMGGTAGAGTVVVGTAGQNTATMGQLVTAIGAATGLGLTASLNVANGTVALTSGISTNAAAPNIGVVSTTLTDQYALQAPAASGTNQGLGVQYQSDLVTQTDGGNLATNGGALTGTITITNNGVTDKFAMGNGAEVLAANGGTVQVLGTSLTNLITAINDETANAGSTIKLAASQDASTGGLFVQTTLKTAEDLAVNTGGITDNVSTVQNAGAGGAANVGAKVVYANAGTNAAADPVLGTITLKNGAGTTTSFVMNGTTGYKTLNDLAANITAAGIGLTASASAAGLTITELNGADYSDAIATGGAGLTDAYTVSQTSNSPGSPAAAAQNASAVINTTTGNGIGQSDTITGSVVLNNGGGAQTLVMGNGVDTGATFFVGGTTIGNLASAISNNLTLGITADVNAATGALELQSKAPSTTIAVGPGGNGATALSDTVTEAVPGSPSIGTLHGESTTTMALASGAISNNDVMTGAVVLTANNTTDTFTMGTVAFVSGAAYTGTSGNYTVNGDTLGNLESAIAADSSLNIRAAASGNTMVLTSNVYNNSTISVGVNSLGDTLSNSGNTPSSASLGEFSGFANGGLGDTVTGTVSFTLNSGATHESFAVTSGETVTALMNQINTHNYGVTASLAPTGGGNGFDNLTLTSNTYGTAGQIQVVGGGTDVTDTTATSTLSYSMTSAYNVGLSNTSVYDLSSGQSGVSAASFVANTGGSNGTATISYSDGAGQSLTATDLSNQIDAEHSLTTLNSAITDVAAQDGYIGAQINTLNAVSQVLSTQQENVESAQNAVQATDYASATSNMSKYEILSQTGIAALAQANTVQQEVVKLLT